MNQPLAERARQVLRGNDRGGYTIPTAGLYPFQWNWDASVCALGWMTFDEARAWQEIDTLFSGQWTEADYGGGSAGLLAHITFHQDADSYFPGPGEWGTQALRVRTSSISQPPLHATMVRWMQEMARDRAAADAAVRRLFPRLLAHHRWWYRTRDPEGTGLVRVLHPWETGMDNSPAWDRPLVQVPATTRAYQRRDLDHVDASMRPPKTFYDRVVYLMDANREAGFDPVRMAREGRFQVNDIGIICILQRASRDLVHLARQLGEDAAAGELWANVERTQRAVSALWSGRWQQPVSRDLLTGELLDEPTSAGLLAAYAGFDCDIGPAVRDTLAASAYGIASTRRGAARYDAPRYWRGPVWQHINLLIARGLAERGRADLAGRIQGLSARLFEQAGFHEYYHPETGSGLGGRDFSWTAATYLYWTAAEAA
jgi:hypothetical protein